MLELTNQICSTLIMLLKRLSFALINNFKSLYKIITFAVTIPATLPVSIAYKGGSITSKLLTQDNTPPMPLSDAHLGGFLIL